MLFKNIFIFFLIIFSNLSFSFSEEIRIITKIDDKIITNFDIEQEKIYLQAFNKSLTNLNKSELFVLSKNSLIKYHIKDKEIKKFFNIDKISKLEEKLIEENYLNNGFKNKNEYKTFLKKNNLEYDIVKKKLKTDRLWNTLVFEKYQNKVKINNDEIKKKIETYAKNQKNRFELNISEILFDFGISFDEVKKFIEAYSFENAALKYSISNSASAGGKIGWVNLNNLNDELKKQISNIEIGEITQPIKSVNGNIILKLNSKRKVKTSFDLDKEVKKQISYENNRQLNSFSLNYFQKLKNNTSINEY